MIHVPKPRIKWEPTWGQYGCFDKSCQNVYGYGPTFRIAYTRWYITFMKRYAGPAREDQ